MKGQRKLKAEILEAMLFFYNNRYNKYGRATMSEIIEQIDKRGLLGNSFFNICKKHEYITPAEDYKDGDVLYYVWNGEAHPTDFVDDVYASMYGNKSDMPTEDEIHENLNMNVLLKQFNESIETLNLQTDCIRIADVHVRADAIGIHAHEEMFVLTLYTKIYVGAVATYRIPSDCTKIHIIASYNKIDEDKFANVVEITFS